MFLFINFCFGKIFENFYKFTIVRSIFFFKVLNASLKSKLRTKFK